MYFYVLICFIIIIYIKTIELLPNNNKGLLYNFVSSFTYILDEHDNTHNQEQQQEQEHLHECVRLEDGSCNTPLLNKYLYVFQSLDKDYAEEKEQHNYITSTNYKSKLICLTDYLDAGHSYEYSYQSCFLSSIPYHAANYTDSCYCSVVMHTYMSFLLVVFCVAILSTLHNILLYMYLELALRRINQPI